GVASAHHRVTYGLAATGALVPAGAMGVSPFVELWGQYTGAVSLGDNPLALTLGAKVFPAISRWGELTVGTDVRVTGAPGGIMPGLPSWRSFVQIAMRFGEALQSEGSAAAAACPERASACVDVTAQVAPAPLPVVAPAPPRLLAIGGKVTDARWDEPLEGARVYVTGLRGATAVDPNSGEFVLCPVTAGAGVVQVRVEASGYQSEEQVVPRSELAETTPLTFALRRSDAATTGRLQGSVLDAKSGQTVKDASVSVPGAQISIAPDQDGSFRATLKVGRYEAMVSAPGYETQKKVMNIHLDEVTIWNVDLRPRKAADLDATPRRSSPK
ncbi:MAG TPA: carboxypeptidase regulatory-like domain-containing protein, partial [Myxococcota bacterium]|nr:carboxypeptidase regulatory-like domain-containing protein [Myxococcota bacterium]